MARLEQNPSAVSLNTPSDSAVCVPIVVRMEVQILSIYAIHEGNGFVVHRVVCVNFVRFV